MAMNMMDTLPQVGGRVRVVGTPHDPAHKDGVVRQRVDGLFGIEFDAAPGVIHHWYAGTEIMAIPDDEESETEPGEPMTDMRRAGSGATAMRSFGGFMMLSSGTSHMIAKALKDAKGAGHELKSLLWASPNYEAVMAGATSGGKRKAVAVLPLSGLLEHTQSLYGWFMGGTDLRQWGAAFDSLLANDAVKAIVIDANTPGGTAFGTPETADKVFKARGIKPVVAVVNPMMDSAGYYIGSAAEKVFITPSGEAGSIGTVQEHWDWSKAMEAEGVSVDIIKSGANKYEGHPYGPLSEETRQHFQADVDELNGMFTAAVAKHRGVSVSTVKSQFGDGRVFTAKAAVERGMVDKIATLEQVIRRLDAGTLNLSGIAQEDWSQPVTMETPKPRTGDDALRMLNLRSRG